MTFSELIAARLADGDLMGESLKMYRWQMKRFAEWLRDLGHDMPTPELVAAYFDTLQRPKADGGLAYKPSSTRAMWTIFRYFDKWFVSKNEIAASMMPVYQLPKLQKPVQYVCPAYDMDLLVQAALKFEDPFRSRLTVACIFVLATATMRRGDLFGFRVCDFDARARTLYVERGKGGKSRKVSISTNCVAMINAWLEVRPKDCTHDRLFCWSPARWMGETGLYTLLAEASHAAGFAGNVKTHKPHAMRHGGASKAHNNGEPLDSTRVRLGHKYLLTTQIYVHTEEAALDKSRNTTEIDLPVDSLPEDLKKFVLAERSREAADGHAPLAAPSAELAALREELAALREAIERGKTPSAKRASPDPIDRPRGKVRHRRPPRK